MCSRAEVEGKTASLVTSGEWDVPRDQTSKLLDFFKSQRSNQEYLA